MLKLLMKMGEKKSSDNKLSTFDESIKLNKEILDKEYDDVKGTKELEDCVDIWVNKLKFVEEDSETKELECFTLSQLANYYGLKDEDNDSLVLTMMAVVTRIVKGADSAKLKDKFSFKKFKDIIEEINYDYLYENVARKNMSKIWADAEACIILTRSISAKMNNEELDINNLIQKELK